MYLKVPDNLSHFSRHDLARSSIFLYRVSIWGVIPQLGSRSKSRSAKFLSLTLTLILRLGCKKFELWYPCMQAWVGLSLGNLRFHLYSNYETAVSIPTWHGPDFTCNFPELFWDRPVPDLPQTLALFYKMPGITVRTPHFFWTCPDLKLKFYPTTVTKLPCGLMNRELITKRPIECTSVVISICPPKNYTAAILIGMLTA